MPQHLKSLLMWLVAWLACCALLWGAGYLTGMEHGEKAGIKAEAVRQAAVTQALRQEISRGQVAEANLSGRLTALDANFTQLQGAYDALRQRAPLVVRPAVRTVGAERCAGGAPGGAGGQDGGVAADGAQQPDAGGADDHLSGMAVRVWNAALAGGDLDAGSCGPDDAATQACAADSGVSLDDAWRNHITNAKLCAVDRERYQALIDFLHNRTPLGGP